MFLHLGANTVVPLKDLVAILNLETAKQGTATQEFLKTVQDEGFVRRITDPGKEKSFVITNNCIYLSPISASTLAKRSTSLRESLRENEQSSSIDSYGN